MATNPTPLLVIGPMSPIGKTGGKTADGMIRPGPEYKTRLDQVVAMNEAVTALTNDLLNWCNSIGLMDKIPEPIWQDITNISAKNKAAENAVWDEMGAEYSMNVDVDPWRYIQGQNILKRD